MRNDGIVEQGLLDVILSCLCEMTQSNEVEKVNKKACKLPANEVPFIAVSSKEKNNSRDERQLTPHIELFKLFIPANN